MNKVVLKECHTVLSICCIVQDDWSDSSSTWNTEPHHAVLWIQDVSMTAAYSVTHIH